MRWHGRHMVVATVVAVAAAGNARADDLALPLDPPVLQQLGLPPLPPVPTPALPSLPVPLPKPPALPSLPPVSVPKPPSLPSLPSLPSAPAPALPQTGRVPASVPRQAAGRAPGQVHDPHIEARSGADECDPPPVGGNARPVIGHLERRIRQRAALAGCGGNHRELQIPERRAFVRNHHFSAGLTRQTMLHPVPGNRGRSDDSFRPAVR